MPYLAATQLREFLASERGVTLKKIRSSENFRKQAEVFLERNVSQGTIAEAEENALVSVYNRKDTLRLERFNERVRAGTKRVHSRSLPPTSSAAKYHSLRVYCQVQQWLGRDILPENWGWKFKCEMLLPNQTDKDPAPRELSAAIRCTCTTGCSTRRCGCRKEGLECTSACTGCKGICSNVGEDDDDDELDKSAEL